MILHLDDINWTLPARLSWDAPTAAIVSGSEAWLRASRHQVDDLRDEQGHRWPLRQNLWVSIFPPRDDIMWRAEADGLAIGVVGRSVTSEGALHDWRKRMRATIHRFLELRPFEMTEEEREIWMKLQDVIDVPRYRATKPMIVRQIGAVVRSRPGLVVVRWEDGAQEKIDPAVFDEVFSRFKIGQLFEATVTRSPLNFRIIRADAVRRLPRKAVSDDRSKAIWNHAVASEAGDQTADTNAEVDEGFWLQTPPG